MIAFALLVAPLPMVAASLYADANKLHSIQRKDEPTASASVADERGVNLGTIIFIVAFFIYCIVF